MKMPDIGWAAIGFVLLAANIFYLLSGALLAALLMLDGHSVLAMSAAIAWLMTILSHAHEIGG